MIDARCINVTSGPSIGRTIESSLENTVAGRLEKRLIRAISHLFLIAPEGIGLNGLLWLFVRIPQAIRSARTTVPPQSRPSRLPLDHGSQSHAADSSPAPVNTTIDAH